MNASVAAPERRIELDASGIGLVLVCCVLWGLQQVAAKAIVADLAPLLQGGLRSIGAALLLWGWARLRGIPIFNHDGTLGPGIMAGVLFGVEFGCIYLGIPHTSASRLIVFLYTAPFWVAILLPFFVKAERLNGLQAVGLLCAFCALFYAFAEGFASHRHDQLVGDALGLLGGLLWAFTTLTVRATRLARASAEKTLFYQLAISGPILLGFSALAAEPWPVAVPAIVVTSMLYQTVVVAFASYLGWFWLLRNYAATRLSAFTFFTPLFGLIFGTLLLSEHIGHRIVIALVFVSLGIYLVNRPARKSVMP